MNDFEMVITQRHRELDAARHQAEMRIALETSRHTGDNQGKSNRIAEALRHLLDGGNRFDSGHRLPATELA